MVNGKFILLAGIISILQLAPARVVMAQEGGGGSLEEIWTALRERQERVQTARVSWTYQLMKSEHGVTDTLVASGADPKLADDLKSELHTSRLSLAGDRVRYETIIPSFVDNGGGRFVPGISAFDGDEQQFFTRSSRRDRPSSGSIMTREAFREWGNIHILPLTIALRPLRPEFFGPDPGEWQLVDRPTVVDGRQCVVLERLLPSVPEAEPPGQRGQQAYLDPAHEFRLLRYTNTLDGRVTVQLDARYGEKEGAPAWVPSSWTSSMFGAVTGKLGQSSQNRLTGVVLNEPIPDEHFRIKYPPGTQVRRINTPYDTQMFVAQRDGELVPASPREHLNVAGVPESRWPAWLMLSFGVLILAVAVGWAFRKKRA